MEDRVYKRQFVFSETRKSGNIKRSEEGRLTSFLISIPESPIFVYAICAQLFYAQKILLNYQPFPEKLCQSD